MVAFVVLATVSIVSMKSVKSYFLLPTQRTPPFELKRQSCSPWHLHVYLYHQTYIFPLPWTRILGRSSPLHKVSVTQRPYELARPRNRTDTRKGFKVDNHGRLSHLQIEGARCQYQSQCQCHDETDRRSIAKQALDLLIPQLPHAHH